MKPSDPASAYILPEIPIVTSFENQRPRSGVKSAEGDEYFALAPKIPHGTSHSAPTSPASINKYNVSFSPRITFHETWPSGEYDRRGEVATCNRLTPILAQQIKEELNTFKMVCDIVLPSTRNGLTRKTGDGRSRAVEGLYPLFLNDAFVRATKDVIRKFGVVFLVFVFFHFPFLSSIQCSGVIVPILSLVP